MKVLTAAQMRELDRRTIAGGIAGDRLMARAGAAVARVLERDFAAALSGPVLALCGKGNNGGDGLVVAR
ncbi:MAG: NAD(P)H-hydrate epimerase, partial [Terriglobales bacterium]